MDIHVKFYNETSIENRKRVYQSMSRIGATSFKPLFPGDADEDLSTLYIVSSPVGYTHQILSLLEKMEEIEFVEVSPVRKLIRPVHERRK